MLNAPIKPKIIGKYEEPIRENYTYDLPLMSSACTLNELHDLIKKTCESNNVTLPQNIDDTTIYCGSYGVFHIKIQDDNSYKIAYDKWERIIQKECKSYSKYKPMMDEYYKELELYNARVEKINKMIEAGEL